MGREDAPKVPGGNSLKRRKPTRASAIGSSNQRPAGTVSRGEQGPEAGLPRFDPVSPSGIRYPLIMGSGRRSTARPRLFRGFGRRTPGFGRFRSADAATRPAARPLGCSRLRCFGTGSADSVRPDSGPRVGARRTAATRIGPSINDPPMFGRAPSGAKLTSVADARSPALSRMEAARRSGSSGPAVLAHPTRRSSPEARLGLPAFVGASRPCVAPFSSLPARSSRGPVRLGSNIRVSVEAPIDSVRPRAGRSPCEREARARSRARRPQGSPQGQPGRGLQTGNVHLVSGNAACSAFSGSRPAQPFGDCSGGQPRGTGSGLRRKTISGHRRLRDGSSRLLGMPAQVGLSGDSSSRILWISGNSGGRSARNVERPSREVQGSAVREQETARADWSHWERG